MRRLLPTGLTTYAIYATLVNMNLNEARMVVVEEIADILYDLTEDEDATQEAKQELKQAMTDAADLIAEALDLDVVDITDGIATVKLNLAGPDVPL